MEETHGSVPLTVWFQCHNTMLEHLQDLKRIGFAGRDPRPSWHQTHGRRHPLAPPNRLDRLIQDLIQRERLPCIFFTFGRRRAEELAWEIAGIPLVTGPEREALRKMFHELCARFGLTRDRSVEALAYLVERGIAYHHAGMLPTVKEVVERCFTSRLIKLIVTTETFALGINMPARSVILDTLKKRANSGFELLRRRDFLQMAGRAGRRGMDEAGFVYLRINPAHVSYTEVLHILQAQPEPVQSRFNTTYATLLNLYRRHGRTLLEVFPHTLYYYQTSGARRQLGLSLMERKLDLLNAMGYLTPTELTPKGQFGSWLYGYELLLTELHTAQQLAALDPTALAILLLAIVFEPKPRSLPPKSHRISKRLAHLCQEPLAHIHQQETRWHIHPRTKTPAFHLAHAMDAWMTGEPFDRLTKLCDVDDGEIVRYFRMTVQLLRQLTEAPSGDLTLQSRARKALGRINRDVVDAEAQLRMG